MKKSKNNISNWLAENGNPEIESFIEKNLAIIENIRSAMETKGWKSQDLATALDKSPSEVSKWLSGMHNLTLKSIVKMEQVLEICLLHTSPIKQYEYVYLGTLKNQEEFSHKANNYKEAYADQEFEIAM